MNKETIKNINLMKNYNIINSILIKKYPDLLIKSSFYIPPIYYSNNILNKDVRIELRNGLLSIFKIEKIKVRGFLYKIRIYLKQLHGGCFNSRYRNLYIVPQTKNIFFYTDINKLFISNKLIKNRVIKKINNEITKYLKINYEITNPDFAPKKIQNLLIFQ